MKDRMKITAEFVAVLKDKDGHVKDRIVQHNEFTNAGYDLISKLLGDAEDKIDVLAIGWGVGADTPFDPVQTDLQGASKNRKAAAYVHTPGTKVMTLSATWAVNEPIAGTVDIGEYGVFNALAAGSMLSRAVRNPALSKLATDELDLTWTLTLSQP